MPYTIGREIWAMHLQQLLLPLLSHMKASVVWLRLHGLDILPLVLSMHITRGPHSCLKQWYC